MPSRTRRKRIELLHCIAACTAAAVLGCSSGDRAEPPAKTDAPKPDATPQVEVRFTDVTQTTGIAATYQNGEAALQRSIVESLGGGVGMFDMDLDGMWDLYFPGGGELPSGEALPGAPSSVWRNLGDMNFSNVSATSGADIIEHYTHGCAMGDFDGDGFDDILVTGYGGLTLFQNQGDGTFQNVTEATQLTSAAWSSSAAWADLNGDGHLDAFIANYADWSWAKNPECYTAEQKREICSPQDFSPLLDIAFLNNGDGTFTAQDAAIGISEAGKGLGVLAVDVNQDSAIDVYVANDTTKNLLFLNDGTGNFSEKGVLSGTAYDQRGVSNGSMGVAATDYNNDGQPDIWVTNYENETFALYHNDGDGMYRCLTESTGITALGNLYVGFGTVAADFLLRGYEDLIVSNGHVMMYPVYSEIEQEPLYVFNDGRGQLKRIEFTEDSYFGQGHRGRGVVFGDLDLDGKLDLVFSHVNEPASILKQTSTVAGTFVELELVGTQSSRDAIGAHVWLKAGGQTQYRTIVGGGSYLSQNPYVVHFGVPADQPIEEIKVTWPSGTTEILSSVQTGTRTLVIEGRSSGP